MMPLLSFLCTTQIIPVDINWRVIYRTAVANAKGYLAAEEKDFFFILSLGEVEIEGQARTTVRLLVEGNVRVVQ